MKKKLLVGFLTACILGLTACSEVHTHSFAAEWSSNEEIHWHACDCGAEVMDSVGAHVDANEDEKCDVCQHAVPSTKHTHSFAAEWSSNEEIHWHACACDSKVLDSVGAHIDNNNDGVCDVCSFAPNHEHTYKAEYVYSADGHWHEASCGHDVTSQVEAHTAANGYGLCDTCGYRISEYNPTTVSTAINDVVANKANVNNSKISYYSGYGYGYELNDVTTTEKKADHFYQKGSTGETFYYPNGEEVIGIKVGTYGNELVPATTDNLSGYEYNLGQFLYNMEDVYAYGTEDLVYQLYTFAETVAITEVTESIEEVDGKTVYSFAYTAYSALYSDNYYTYASILNVSFVLDYENIVISEATIEIEYIPGQYYDWMVGDYVTNVTESTDDAGNVTYTILPEAQLESAAKYEIVQNYEEKSPSYKPEEILYSSFNVVNADTQEVIGENLTVTKGDTLNCVLADVLPATAIKEFNEVKVYYNGTEASFWETDIISTYNEETGIFTIKGVVAGEYKIEVKAGNASKEFNLTVNSPLPTEIYASVLYGDQYSFEIQNEITVTVGQNIFVQAQVDNEYADSSYTVKFKDAYEGATLEESLIYAGSYMVTLPNVGEYYVVITSSVVETLSVELKIVIEEEQVTPDPVESVVFSGEFTHPLTGVASNNEITLNSDGTGTFNVQGNAYLGTFKYSVDDNGLITVTDVVSLGGETFGLELEFTETGLYMVATCDETGLYLPLELTGEMGGSGDVETVTEVVYSGVFTHPLSGQSTDNVITLKSDGTATFAIQSNWYCGTFEYTVDGSIITVTNVYCFSGETMAFELEYNEEGLYMVATCDEAGLYLPLQLTTETNEGGNDDVVVEGSFEDAVTYVWTYEYGMDDIYNIIFYPNFDNTTGTVICKNVYQGNVFGSTTYTYEYTNGTLVLTTDATDSADLIGWYFNTNEATFNASFTELVVGGYYTFTIATE